MVLKWALSNSARYSTWNQIGSCRVPLDFLHGSELGAVYFCPKFFTVHKKAGSSSPPHFTSYTSWCRVVLLAILHGTKVGAVVFCSKFFMVEMWASSSFARPSAW